MSTTIVNCTSQPEELKLEPNPDISGVGVLIGSMGTAHLAVAVTVGYYFLAFNPAKDPYRSPDNDGSETGQPSWKAYPKLLDDFEGCFNSCLLQLCDVQLVTGLGILIAAYRFLPLGLSAYHWQMAVYLAWFANLTHQSGLTFLRKYLYLHPRQRNLRAVFMTFFFFMLLVAEVPTIYFNWPNAIDALLRNRRDTGTEPKSLSQFFLPPYPGNISQAKIYELTAANSSSFARCYFDTTQGRRLYQQRIGWFDTMRDNGWPVEGLCVVAFDESAAELSNTTAFQSAILSILLLVFSFTTRLIKLFKSSAVLLSGRIRPFFSRKAKGIITRGYTRRLGRYKRPTAPQSPVSARLHHRERFEARILYGYTKRMLALILLCRLYADFYSSMLSEIFWLIISATWGSLHIATLRRSVVVAEDEITVGQLFAILFLAGPVVAAGVSLWPILSSMWTLRRLESDQNPEANVDIEMDVLDSTNPTLQPETISRTTTPTIQQILDADYSETPWAGPTMGLAALQVLALISIVFSAMYNTDISALKVLRALLVWFFWTQPATCYFMIRLGLLCQESDFKFYIGIGRPSAPDPHEKLLLWLWKLRTASEPQFWWFICLVLVAFSVAPLTPLDTVSAHSPEVSASYIPAILFTGFQLVALVCIPVYVINRKFPARGRTDQP